MNIIQLAATAAIPTIEFYPIGLEQRSGKCMPMVMRSNAVRRGRGPLADLMRSKGLYPVFQPIVSLRDGAIYSHEALIRGPPPTMSWRFCFRLIQTFMRWQSWTVVERWGLSTVRVS